MEFLDWLVEYQLISLPLGVDWLVVQLSSGDVRWINGVSTWYCASQTLLWSKENPTRSLCKLSPFFYLQQYGPNNPIPSAASRVSSLRHTSVTRKDTNPDWILWLMMNHSQGSIKSHGTCRRIPWNVPVCWNTVQSIAKAAATTSFPPSVGFWTVEIDFASRNRTSISRKLNSFYFCILRHRSRKLSNINVTCVGIPETRIWFVAFLSWWELSFFPCVRSCTSVYLKKLETFLRVIPFFLERHTCGPQFYTSYLKPLVLKYFRMNQSLYWKSRWGGNSLHQCSESTTFVSTLNYQLS